jgi:urea ABC transporter permease protein UrtB
MIGVEMILNMVTSVATLAVIAVGLYIIFGLMKVINMAHGDMVMLGAYSTVIFTQMGLSFWVSATLATITVGLIGGLIERGVVRFLYKSGNLSTMLATWGVSIVLQQVVKLVFGPQGQFVDTPVMTQTTVFGVEYPTYRLISLVLCVIVLTAVFFLIKKTPIGIIVRSTMDNPKMAEAMGINTNQVYLYGFVAGSALAGFAGALIAPIASVSPLMGLDFVTKSFLVVIVGGVETMLSVIGGSIIIAGFQSVFSNFIGATIAYMSILLIVVVIIWVRPQGVFSKK